MCLLIVQTPDSRSLTEAETRSAWESNSDGAGYAFPTESGLVVRKFLRLRKFVRAYQRDREAMGAKVPFLVHFRMGTHGLRCLENTHPFEVVQGEVAVAHNGIFSICPPSGWSDTRAFVATHLAGYPVDAFFEPEYLACLRAFAGPMNKLAFLDRHGRTSIVGEEDGYWENGNWFSSHCLKFRQNVAGFYVSRPYYTHAFGEVDESWGRWLASEEEEEAKALEETDREIEEIWALRDCLERQAQQETER